MSISELQVTFDLSGVDGGGGNATSIIDSVINAIATSFSWANTAVNMLYIFIPIGTISSAVFTIYTNKILLVTQIFAFNRAQKTAS